MNKLKSFLIIFFERSKFNMLAAGWINFLGSPLYYFICAKLLPQPYESFTVRISSSLISIPLLFTPLCKGNSRILAAVYWYFWIVLALPTTFTFMLLMNDFSGIWLVAETVMLFIVMLFIENFVGLVTTVFIGIAVSCIGLYLKQGHLISLDIRILEYSVPIPLALLCGMLFSYNTKKGYVEKEKVKVFQERAQVFKSLAGSIAHELRNPLSAINFIGDQIKDTLNEGLNESSKSKLSVLTGQISDSIRGANNIINIILSDLRESPIDAKDFNYLNASEAVLLSIESYGYKDQAERSKVIFDAQLSKDFVIHAVGDRFTFIIYNLLKNALYYLRDYPDSVVHVGSEVRTIDNQNWNVIYVLDTGPGISKDNIFKLFGDFYTSGKKEGTGLGLAFCKRNMKAFGGDIICESELGKWTKFSLLFPSLSDEDLEKAKLQLSQKSNQEDNQDSKNTKSVSAETKTKILIVDDEKTNLLVTKSKIERNLQISCDLAHDGTEAVELVSCDIHKYQLILMDIQMPEMNGVMAAQKIRAINKNIPIIALTSLEYEDFQNANLDNFNYYLNKPVAGHVLYRTINKFMPDTKDGLEYLGGQDQYLGELKGKKVLLADDQELNLKISSRKLTSVGMEIVEARDGKELLEIYKNSLSEGTNNQLKSKFDLIITDINMPIMSGDEVISVIRKIERDSKISFKNRIPAIALTGDGDWDHINAFFKLGIDDYFVKGSDSEKLIRTAALYLSPQKIYFNKHHLEQHKKMAQLQDGALQILNIEKMRYFNENDRKEFLKVFLEESALEITNIRNLQNSDKKVELSKSLHALKGICGNIGAEVIFSLIKELEKDLKDENLKNSWCDDLFSKYNDLQREITKLLI